MKLIINGIDCGAISNLQFNGEEVSVVSLPLAEIIKKKDEPKYTMPESKPLESVEALALEFHPQNNEMNTLTLSGNYSDIAVTPGSKTVKVKKHHLKAEVKV